MTRRVVIVDDEDDIREIAVLSLERFCGWQVVALSSGNGVAGTVAAIKPDVVLLDVMMPGKDGPATLQELRAHDATKEVPVLFLTAKTQERDRVKLAALGAVGLIAKPFNPAGLGEEIRRLLGWSS